MSAQNADPVRWEVARCWLAPKVQEDQENLDALLSQGWEPFHVSSSGRAGYIYHLRRAARIDGSGVIK